MEKLLTLWRLAVWDREKRRWRFQRNPHKNLSQAVTVRSVCSVALWGILALPPVACHNFPNLLLLCQENYLASGGKSLRSRDRKEKGNKRKYIIQSCVYGSPLVEINDSSSPSLLNLISLHILPDSFMERMSSYERKGPLQSLRGWRVAQLKRPRENIHVWRLNYTWAKEL